MRPFRRPTAAGAGRVTNEQIVIKVRCVHIDTKRAVCFADRRKNWIAAVIRNKPERIVLFIDNERQEVVPTVAAYRVFERKPVRRYNFENWHHTIYCGEKAVLYAERIQQFATGTVPQHLFLEVHPQMHSLRPIRFTHTLFFCAFRSCCFHQRHFALTEVFFSTLMVMEKLIFPSIVPAFGRRNSRGQSVFYVLSSLTGATMVLPWGAGGDRPAVADYDRDGKADLAIFRAWEKP